jgi:adenylosuccinate lyase
MIARYTRPEMAVIWSEQRKLETWLEVELAVCETLADRGLIPPGDLDEIRLRADFDLEAVKKREKETDHDVAAFVDVVASSVGEAGRWIHYGLTSSDVVDTGLALQLREAGEVVLTGACELTAALAERAREFRNTLCAGRTHGVHAEPTTFGLKLAGFAFESDRSARRLEEAFRQLGVGKLSGAVGTYSTLEPEVEQAVLDRLGLEREPISTQIVPRDRHAQLLSAIALAGSSLERLATELRHLQRTEVREVEEAFKKGQKGSSAMPHKRNPIVSERVTGLARVLRGNAQAGLENVALWHERDISHSSVERVILPDSTSLIDYVQSLMTDVTCGMRVHPERMRENLELTHGATFSQSVLSALVETGLARDEAYRIVQRCAQQAWDERLPFRSLLEGEAAVTDRLDGDQLDELFDYGRFLRNLPAVFERLEQIEARLGAQRAFGALRISA